MDRTMKAAAVVLVLAACVLCTVSSSSADAADETADTEPIMITADYLGTVKDADQGVYNIPEGDYKVGQSIVMSCTLVFQGDSSLDLNGYTLNGQRDVTLRNTGNLTIYDSSVEQDGIIASYDEDDTGLINEGELVVEKAIINSDIGIVSNGRSLTVGNVSFDSGSSSSLNTRAIVINSGTAEINGGITDSQYRFGILINDDKATSSISVTMTSGEYSGWGAGLQINGGKSSSAVSSLTMNGGTIIGGGTTGVGLAGNGLFDYTEITINEGSTIKSNNQVALYHPQIGDLTVNGGTITGYTGIQFCGTGNITITGGTITGNGEYNPTSKGTSDTSGTFDDGAALSVISRGEGYQSGGKVAVEITGGNLVSEKASAVQTYRIAVSDEDKWVTGDDTKLKSYVGSVEITGGTFESPTGTDPISYDESKESKGVYTISGGKFSGSVDDNLLEDGLKLDDDGQVVGETGKEFDIAPGDFLGLGTYSDDGSTVTFDLTRDYRITGDGIVRFSSLSDQGYTSIVINGNGRTVYGEFVFDAQRSGSDSESYSVEINGLTLDGSEIVDGYGIVLQNQSPAKNQPRTVDITIEGCTIQNFSSKGIYLHSVSSVTIRDLTMDNCAYRPEAVYDGEGQFLYYTRGDYAIDIDVTGVDCESIVIDDVRFVGDNGVLAALKIAQRGGAGDDPSVWGDATIGRVVLGNLDFSASVTEVDVMIGSEPNINDDGQEELRDYNSAFPVQITAMVDTALSVWGGDRNGDENLILELTGGTVIRTTGQTDDGKTTGDIAITVVSGYARASGVLGPNMSLAADYDAVDTSALVDRSNGGLDISEPEPDPFPPFIPGDDDDVYIPPTVVVDQSSADDDKSVKIAACAAAAVAAAILAVLAIALYRKD